MVLITNNFTGNTKLWQVFWVQNILVGAFLNFLVELFLPHISELQTYVLLLFVVFYSLWVIVGMWQCAFNAKWKFWGYIVRGAFIGIVGLLLFTLIQSV
jgi:hypothetical protein